MTMWLWSANSCLCIILVVVNFLEFTLSELLESGTYTKYCVIISRAHEVELKRCIFQVTLHIILTPCHGRGDNVSLELQRNDAILSDASLYYVRGSGASIIAGPESESTRKMSYYQDTLNGAFIAIQCAQKSHFIAYDGVIHHKDRQLLIITRTEQLKTFKKLQARPCFVEIRESPIFPARFTEYSFSDHIQIIPHRQKLPTEIQKVRNTRAVMGSVTSYTVEVLVVVDFSVYRRWLRRHKGKPEETKVMQTKLEIQKYYTQVMNGVDLRYRNIEFADFAIRIKPVGVVIGDSPNVFPWTLSLGSTSRDQLDADQALKDFRKWLNNTNGLPQHDHAVFFTSLDLYTLKEKLGKRIQHTSGLAYIGTMCQYGNSISIIEEQGGFQSVGTVSHEIGHSLGARHDGEDNSCRSEDRFIMAASGIGPIPADKRQNPWHFSECSIDYFRDFIASLLANDSMCLHDLRIKDVEMSKYSMPGQLYNADEQCRLIWGAGSYLCRGAEFGNASNICTAMYCRDPSTNNDCVLHTAARGTSCGSKQWCSAGRCTFSEDAPEMTDGCVLGDQPDAAFNGLTCDELMNQSPSYCYQAKVVARCCSSCRKHFTWRNGCEYGDRIQGCEHWHCSHTSGTRDILSDCCNTCNIGDVILPTSPPEWNTELQTIATPTDYCRDTGHKGLKCELLIEKYGKYMCYSPPMSEMCCETCRRQVDTFNKACQFGDRSPTLCAKISNITDLSCSKYRSQCCSTCTAEHGTSNRIRASICIYVVMSVILIFSRESVI